MPTGGKRAELYLTVEALAPRSNAGIRLGVQSKRRKITLFQGKAS